MRHYSSQQNRVLVCQYIERMVVFNLKFKIFLLTTEPNSVVVVVIRLGAVGPRVQIPACSTHYLFSEMSRTITKLTQPPIQQVPGIMPGVKLPGKMLTTHLHLAPRLRMSSAELPLPLYVFKAWTTLPLTKQSTRRTGLF